jgi:zinc protease
MRAGGFGRSWVIPALVVFLQVALVTGTWAQGSAVKEVKLDNGLTVLMKENHAAPVFTAQVWFKVGSRNERVGITGISHMLEHMLFNSSKNYKKGEITRMIRERGGIENAATWTDFTYYWQLLGSENLEFSLKTLAERVGNSLLLKEEFDKERTVVLSELQGKENNPDWLIYQDLWATAFMAHPYQWPVIGWASDVRNVDVSQLRDYYQTYYHPNNATLVLVGDFDSAKALALVRKYFGGKPSGKLPRPVYTTEPPQKGRRVVEVRREGNAERVAFGYHIPSLTDPDTYPLMVLDQVMSGGRSSRLYQAMVETQLATSAWSSAGSRRDPALFMFGATARQGVTADALEKALLEQIERAKTTLPTDDEMQAARNQLEAYFVFQNDSVSDQGEQLGYYSTLASWRYADTIVPKVKAVTPEQVQAVARKYLVEDNLTVARFIPTKSNGAGAGNGSGPMGPLHRSKVLDAEGYTRAESTGSQAPGNASGIAHPGRSTSPDGKGRSLPSTRNHGPSTLVRPHREVLPNGITVIVQENHSNPTVSIAGNLKAGSYFDPPGKSGVASLVAEMVGRGTRNRTALQLAREVDFVGAELNMRSGVESADFTAKALKKDLPLVMDILSDQLRNATFPQDQFERAIGEELSNLERSKESPDAQAFRAFKNSVFPAGHPYHDLTFDQAESELKTITRDDLAAFYSAYYRPDTMNVVIAGDVKAPEAVEMVKRYFGDWQASGPKPEVSIPTIPPQKEAAKIVVPMMDKSEVSVVFGHAMGVKRSDPDFYAVRIMNQILGGAGALASLLGESIREKNGLAYDVYSTFDATLGAGPWYAALGTNPKNADKAVGLLKTDIERFRTKGATRQQFTQAREFIIGVFPIALETNAGIARMLLSAEFYGLGMDYLANYAKIYRAVTLEQVNAAAKKYLHPDAATLVIAGPCEEHN